MGWLTNKETGNVFETGSEGISESDFSKEMSSDVIQVEMPMETVKMNDIPEEQREAIEMFYKEIWDQMSEKDLETVLNEIYSNNENESDENIKSLSKMKFLELPESTRQMFIEHMILKVDAA